MRLDKYLAHAQLGTRKEVKKLIRSKRVRVNDEICVKEDRKLQKEDCVYVDDELLAYDELVYLMLYKPQGVISATEDRIHTTVMDILDAPLPKNCFPVGRLDIDSEGLLLITNDGQLAHQLLSPKKHVGKTYYVECEKALSSEDLQFLESGTIQLDNENVLPAKAQRITANSLYLTIQEGKFHQVKRMLQACENKVCYLKRISMGSLQMDKSLAPGEWRYLSEEEIRGLKQ